MNKYIRNGKEIFSWLAEGSREDWDILFGVMEQAADLAQVPGLYKHIAIMPDGHKGFGMPIGGVIAMDGVIIPNAVGKDIGCGMIASKTGIRLQTPEEIRIFKEGDLKRIMRAVREQIPVGFSHRKESNYQIPPLPEQPGLLHVLVGGGGVPNQIGTLGGGNHFIEFQIDQQGYVWVMIHSGSRNIGSRIADAYHSLAKSEMTKWKIGIPPDLSYFPIDSTEGESYRSAMNWCVEFAELNRKVMMDIVVEIIESLTNIVNMFKDEETYDVRHNYAAMENHFGKNVMVHRKGAVRAREGDLVIIPGSQGTNSFVGTGLGNPLSFNSCSHGSGRRMSRRKAKEILTVADESKVLDDKGILHAIRGEGDLDEAPSAYKDVHKVMDLQQDLVKIETVLTPMGVIKG